MRISLHAGELADLPAAVEVAVFRIAVEAINNVVRHSGARSCQVRLGIEDPGRLVMEISDDGTSIAPWPAGVGLLAMRERAAEVGGSLIAGPTADGGGQNVRAAGARHHVGAGLHSACGSGG